MITSGNTLICLSFALLLMRNDPRQNSLAINTEITVSSLFLS